MSSRPAITLEDQHSLAALIGLGANLDSPFGTAANTLGLAWQRLLQLYPGPAAVSSLYASEPVDCPADTPEFVNAVGLLQLPSSLAAATLLSQLLALEAEFGRTRPAPSHSSRTLDLDLLCFGRQRRQEPELTLPHPRAHRRRFVLAPLVELDPNLVLPGQTATVQTLLEQLPASPVVRRLGRLHP